MFNEEKIKSFIDRGKELGKSREEIKTAYDKAVSDGIFDLQEINQSTEEIKPTEEIKLNEDKGLLDSLIYTPYTPDEVSAYDPNKSTSSNLAGGLARYGQNIAGGISNIGVGIAQAGIGIGKGVYNDISKGLGNWMGIVSDKELNEHRANNINNTGKLISGLADHYKKTYGSMDGLNKAIIEDPTSIVSDVLTVVGIGLAGKAKVNTVQKTALESEKANIINKVKNASTLEQKSLLIKQGIQKSKDIVNKTNQVNTAKLASHTAFKYDPYVAVPKGVIKGGRLLKKGRDNRILKNAQKKVAKGEDILFEAVNPTTRENKAVLKQRVQDLQPYIKKNPLKNSLEDVKGRIDAGKNKALDLMQEYEKNVGVKGNLRTQIIIDKLEKKYQQKIGDSFINADEAKTSQELIDTLKGFGETVVDGDIIKIRRAWDKIEKGNKGFMLSAESNIKGDIYGDANKFFREEIRNSNTKYAEYLKEYHKTNTLSSVLDATIQRRVGQTKGGFIKRGAQNTARVLGVGFGNVPGLIMTEGLIQGTELLASPGFQLTKGNKLLQKGKRVLKSRKLLPNKKNYGVGNNVSSRSNNNLNGGKTVDNIGRVLANSKNSRSNPISLVGNDSSRVLKTRKKLLEEKDFNKHWGGYKAQLEKKGIDIIKAGKEHGLTPNESSSINMYVGNEYWELNRGLRTGKIDNKYSSLNIQLNNALNKLPNYSGIVYREGRLPKKIVDRLIKGKTILDEGFMSTSKNKEAIKEFTVPTNNNDYSIQYKINSKRGKSINKFTDIGEDEVLFKPNTKFRIDSIKKDGEKVLLELTEY